MCLLDVTKLMSSRSLTCEVKQIQFPKRCVLLLDIRRQSPEIKQFYV